MNNFKFWLYTKLLNYYLRRKDFDKVGVYLNKKKELAVRMRRNLGPTGKTFMEFYRIKPANGYEIKAVNT